MTTAITYENHFTTLAGWAPGALQDQQLGYAYEHDGRFIHVFGRSGQLWPVSSGLTFFEQATGSIEDWATRTFGAQKIGQVLLDAGTAVSGVWRPGLYWDEQLLQALGTDRIERRSAEQALHGLVERLSDLLLYVEPEGPGLNAYSARSRELLILASTEAENYWTHYLTAAGQTAPKNGFSTNHYVKLAVPLYLDEFQVELVPFAQVPALRPFAGWNPTAPTQSLPWYHAYNQTKHHRTAHLAEATVERCLQAVAANLILFSVRFGPWALYQSATPLSSLINHLFTIELVGADPATFYVPLTKPPAGYGANGLGWGDSKPWTEPWTSLPLKL
jgi:hypothetical protein